MVEITPDAGWVDFDEHGRPSQTEPVCGDVQEPRAGLARPRAFVRPACRGLLRPTTRAAFGIVTLAHESWHLRGIVNEAQTQCYAVQTTEAVAPPGRPRGRAPLAVRVAADDSARQDEYHSALPTRRPLRPPPEDARLADRLAAQPRWTNTHGRASPGSGELRRPATTNIPSSTSGKWSGVLGAGGGPSREISS